MSKVKRKGWASELKDIDERIEILQFQREDIIQKIKEWKEECAEHAAKPEEIDPLFCSREEPCEQTVTLLDVGVEYRNFVRDQEKKEIDTLFCSREKECEVVPWKIEGGKVLLEKPQVLAKGSPYPWLVDKSKKEAYVENKVSLWQKIRKYLSEQWQHRKINLTMSNSTGQKSN